MLGAGREKKGAAIDLGVGFHLEHKVGEKVARGDVIIRIFANDQDKLTTAKARLMEGITIQSEKCEELPLFYGVI